MQGAKARSWELLRRWQCHNEHCLNENGFRFVDYFGKHYLFDSKEQLQLAIAVEQHKLNVTIEKPLEHIYKVWTGFNGLVTQTSRKTAQFKEKQEEKWIYGNLVNRKFLRSLWLQSKLCFYPPTLFPKNPLCMHIFSYPNFEIGQELTSLEMRKCFSV